MENPTIKWMIYDIYGFQISMILSMVQDSFPEITPKEVEQYLHAQGPLSFSPDACLPQAHGIRQQRAWEPIMAQMHWDAAKKEPQIDLKKNGLQVDC